MHTFSSTTPGLAARSFASIVNRIRPRLISTLCVASFGVGSLSLVPPCAFAAPPPVTVNQPVQVQVVNTAAQPAQVQVVNPVQVQGTVSLTGSQPVQVQGAVETLNDALRQPYLQTATINAADGDFFATVFLSVPAGKRLVIETIVVQFIVPFGQTGLVDLTVTSQGAGILVPLATQTSMDWNVSVGHFTVYTSTLAARLRVDAPAAADGLMRFELDRNSSAGSASFRATVAGYLVDL